MNVKQFSSELRAAIADVQSKGIRSIRCDNLIAYLDRVIQSPNEEPSNVDIERYRAQLQNLNESRMELFRSVITAGQAAIRSSLLLNGGAAVALLAFMGHLAQHNSGKAADFATCLVLFSLGALSIVMVAGFTYLSQFLYASNFSSFHKWGVVFHVQKWGVAFHTVCILLGILSYAFFVWGLIEVQYEFRHYVSE